MVAQLLSYGKTVTDRCDFLEPFVDESTHTMSVEHSRTGRSGCSKRSAGRVRSAEITQPG